MLYIHRYVLCAVCYVYLNVSVCVWCVHVGRARVYDNMVYIEYLINRATAFLPNWSWCRNGKQSVAALVATQFRHYLLRFANVRAKRFATILRFYFLVIFAVSSPIKEEQTNIIILRFESNLSKVLCSCGRTIKL